MAAEPIIDYIIRPHAAIEMARRSIPRELVHEVMSSPGQRYVVRSGRDVLQSVIDDAKTGTPMLVRVFVDVDRHPSAVVTAYRTSKISKYWRNDG